MKRSAIHTILALTARLPLGVLYGLSDFAAWLLYRVVRYRRDVVCSNLARALPELSDAERLDIERQFYRNFTDNFIETAKLLHISDREILARMEFADTAIIDRLLAEGRSIIVYFGHFFNWEWAPSISLHTERKPSDTMVFAQIYRPLRSAAFDRLMLAVRSRFGSESIDKNMGLRRLLHMRRDGIQSITGFMSDQHPGKGDPGLVTTLMGIPTKMITGTETLARKLDMAVVYWDMEKTSRGHYRITTRLMAEHPADLPEGALTEQYTRLLETTIRRNPSIWLWSHKRWKHHVTLPEK